jgi:hypothetical protein
MAHCLWNNDSDCHMYHLGSWKHVTMKKEYGGLGVPDLRELNLCLLGLWIRRYSQDSDKIWKLLIDYKYNTRNPNLFTCRENGVSNFWKGVLWVARVVKMGYRWKLGNGTKVRFWEYVWIGTSSLAIQYWELYCLINEHNKSVSEIWDGGNLKCTFHRCVVSRLFDMWEELVNLVSTVEMSGDEDALIWQFQSNGVYSSQSLYSVINFNGVAPVFVPAVWKLRVPPKVHFFL